MVNFEEHTKPRTSPPNTGNYKVRVAYNSLDDNYLLHAEPTRFGTGYDKTITLALSKAEATEIWRSLNAHFGTPADPQPIQEENRAYTSCNCNACMVARRPGRQSYTSPAPVKSLNAYLDQREAQGEAQGKVTVIPDPDKVSLSRKATRARLNVVLDELIDLKRSLG